MAERVFNIEKFQSYWNSLTTEERSPGGNEIQLMLAEEGTQMSMANKDGKAVALPWLFGSDEDGTSLLFQLLQQSGIATGALDDYMMEETVNTEEAETTETADEAQMSAATEAQLEPALQRKPCEPGDSTASVVGKALLKTVAIVGGVYMAYRMARPTIGPIRFS